jgi:methionyl aminopeptidase
MLQDMRASCQLAADCLTAVGEIIRPGIATNEINAFVHEFIVSRDAHPSPLNYKGFPKSVCTSVNDCVCHGIPGDQLLKDGDIVNVDVTTYLPTKHGYHGDTSVTFYVGEPSEQAILVVESIVTTNALSGSRPTRHNI